jgi:hypothetical protein
MIVAGISLPVATERPFADTVLRALRGLTPTRFVAAIALGMVNNVFLGATNPGPWPVNSMVATVMLTGIAAATVAAQRAGHRRIAWALVGLSYAVVVAAGVVAPFAHQVLIGQVMAHCLALTVAVADARVASGPAGRLTYVTAAIAGVAMGALVIGAILHVVPDLIHNDDWAYERTLPGFASLFALYAFFHWLLFGGAAVLFYGERRLAQATLARLRAAEVTRNSHARQVVESKLQMMQARIEPQFLLNTLVRVKRLYARDPPLAETMLDELGAFLRAAMPRMRDTSSTVGQEAQLVKAYLAILRIRLQNRLDCVIEVPPELVAARLPSMMLLPLVDHAVAHGLGSAADEIRLRICVSRAGSSRLRVAIENTATGLEAFADAHIAGIRERLEVLYGRDARLALDLSGTGGTEAVLDIPFEDHEAKPRLD